MQFLDVVRVLRARGVRVHGVVVGGPLPGTTSRAMDELRAAVRQRGLDGAVTLEPVFCFGLCAVGPAAMLDGAPLARMDDAKIDTLLERAR